MDPAAKAIRDGRQLLDDPDPIKPLIDELVDALRVAVQEQSETLTARRAEALAELEAWSDWGSLAPEQRDEIKGQSQLAPPEVPDLSTDDRLLEALDILPLSGWRDQVGLVPARRDQAKQRAAQLLEPESVSIDPPPATLKTTEELEAYLEQLRGLVAAELDKQKTVVI